MAIPQPGLTFQRKLDPSGKLDFYPTLNRSDSIGSILEADEEVTSFTVSLTAEASAAGLIIATDSTFGPRYANATFSFWVSVDPTMRTSSLFTPPTGIVLGVEITFTTNKGRTDQITVGVRTVQK